MMAACWPAPPMETGGAVRGGDLCRLASGRRGAWRLPARPHPHFIPVPHRHRMTTESPGGSARSPGGRPALGTPVAQLQAGGQSAVRAAASGQPGPAPWCPAHSPAGPDRMSDRLEEAAGHAAPSGGAIVDLTKDGHGGQGPPRAGRAGRRGHWLPACTGLAQLSCRDPSFRAEMGSSRPEKPGCRPLPPSLAGRP